MNPDGAYSQLIRLQEGEKEDEGSSKFEVDESGDNLNIDSHMARFSIQRTSFASRTSSASLQHSQSLRGLSGRIEEDIEQGQLDNKKKPKR
ncbi:ABC transporter B family member 9-like, partial [Trifolium medium]|nr:ABC transporter B family member 9-like [Trifolium medium]